MRTKHRKQSGIVFAAVLVASAMLDLSVTNAQTVTINSNVTQGNFFLASMPDQKAGGAGYFPFGGGTGAIDIFTINTAPFNGGVLTSLSASFLLGDPVALGQSGTVAFGHYTNPTYNGNSTYNNYIVGNTFVPDGTFNFVTEAATVGSLVKLTLSGFQTVGNQSLLTGTPLNIAFLADAPAFTAVFPDGDIGYVRPGVFTPTVTGIEIVPEPGTGALILGSLSALGIIGHVRRRRA